MVFDTQDLGDVLADFTERDARIAGLAKRILHFDQNPGVPARRVDILALQILAVILRADRHAVVPNHVHRLEEGLRNCLGDYMKAGDPAAIHLMAPCAGGSVK